MRRAYGLLLTAAALVLCACDDGEDDDTNASCARIGTLEEGEPLEDAKFLIEHNATDEDTGFQVFVDGEPWDRLELMGPGGDLLLSIDSTGGLTRGLTELFFETSEPENAEVPIPDLLAEFPEGDYELLARSAEEGTAMRGVATLSHAIPAGPVILSPSSGAVVDPASLVIAWEPVTETIDGDPVDIAAYQLIVELDDESHPPGFSKRVLSVIVSAAVTSVSVPPEFLGAGEDYAFEVLALGTAGNQTLSSSSFSTQP